MLLATQPAALPPALAAALRDLGAPVLAMPAHVPARLRAVEEAAAGRARAATARPG